MESAATKRIVIAVLAVVFVAVLGLMIARSLPKPRTRTIAGEIAWVDPDTSRAAIRIVHPKTGSPFEIQGTVPDTCDITVDGKPADLADLHAGDRAEVRGTIYPDLTISADWVRVTHSQEAATQPATPATAGG